MQTVRCVSIAGCPRAVVERHVRSMQLLRLMGTERVERGGSGGDDQDTEFDMAIEK